jgi:predicted nuclease with TOPRIM domain
VDPSSGAHPALPERKVGPGWTLEDIFGWIIKGVLALAIFFIGNEYRDIKAKLDKAEDRIETLEKHNVANEAKDVTSGFTRLEGEVRAVSDRLIRIETTLGHVKERIDKPVRIGGSIMTPTPIPPGGSPH